MLNEVNLTETSRVGGTRLVANIKDQEPHRKFRFTDTYTSEGRTKFGEALTRSKGRAMVLIHPFYHLPSRGDMPAYLDRPNNTGLKEYVQSLRTMIDKVRNLNGNQVKSNGLPILIFADTPETEERTVRIQQLDLLALTRLREQLSQLDFPGNNYYYILTGYGTPTPLDFSGQTGTEKLLNTQNITLYQELDDGTRSFIDYVLSLKQVGLSQVVIAGSDLTGAYHKTEGYKSSSQKPPLTFSKVDWLLRDYYQDRFSDKRRGAQSHPLEVLSPESCVGSAVRAFAFCDVQTDLSQVTYPGKLPVASQVKPKGDVFVITPRK